MDSHIDFVDYLLAIDIGNTHIKVGLFHDGGWQAVWRLSTDAVRTTDEYRVLLQKFLQTALVERVDQVVLACVVPLLGPIFHRVAGALSDAPLLEVTSPGYGLKVQYNPPDSLGADRFASALGAWYKYHTNLVVVGVGTTTTVDVVSRERVFLGGVIAPGPHFLAQAVTDGTTHLPLIPPSFPDHLLGVNTHEAIAVGVGHGFIGMLHELVLRTGQKCGERTAIILTGGWAQRVLPHLAFEATWDPTLTLDGLRYAAAYHAGRV